VLFFSTIAIAGALLGLMVYVSHQFPLLEANPWLAAPTTIIVLFFSEAIMNKLFADYRWHVDEETISSVLPRLHAPVFIRELANSNFVNLRMLGPFAIVRNRSGKTIIFPRTLRREGSSYTFELKQNKLQLVSAKRPQ
jgi:hypothetical protein